VKALLVHNHYQHEGGEDRVFAVEGALLASRGHEVVRYEDDNDRIEEMGRVRAAASAFWNPSAYRELRRRIRDERPDVVHFHNTFPLISPAAYYAARAEGVPTVQTLHNYRLMCLMGMAHREGRPCEDCFGRAVAWPGVLHGCYRGSRAGSAVVAGMVASHRFVGTWRDQVDRYIALSEFARDKFVAQGLPAEKIRVKPNYFDPDPGVGEGRGDYLLFAGRLVPEKGVETLLEAWKALDGAAGLVIVGDGPLAPLVAAAAERDPRIRRMGWMSREELMALMGEALAVVVPSVCYESFPLVLVESFATGTPVLASDLGSLPEIVEHGRTGLLHRPGDARALAEAVQRVVSRPDERAAMRRAARSAYETRYTAGVNYHQLMEIYDEARAEHGLAPLGEVALAGA
jgi:glycosyltransferase involved in cell wall biosynthesis